MTSIHEILTLHERGEILHTATQHPLLVNMPPRSRCSWRRDARKLMIKLSNDPKKLGLCTRERHIFLVSVSDVCLTHIWNVPKNVSKMSEVINDFTLPHKWQCPKILKPQPRKKTLAHNNEATSI